ncbi:MAG: hypothetical protein II670_10005 [Alphaproteobacteria bacterium]|nr:hypothetical protein [Alphaproteobacteria bacterium]
MLKYNKHSFTLVEVSLVLFILAILVSTTLTGSNLMSRAKANKVIKEVQEYRQAINTFYNTYGALPGDFADAQYRLATSGYSTTDIATIQGYNGDLQKQIPINGNQDGSVSAEIDNTNFYSEAFGVWAALGQANLIQEKYSNFCNIIQQTEGEQTETDTSKCVKIGYNIPFVSTGRTNIAGYVFYRPTTDTINATNDDNLMGVVIQGQEAQFQITDQIDTTKRKHIIAMMGFDTNKTFDNDTLLGVRGGGGAIGSNIMRIIDEKIDDGYPLTGSIYGLNGYGNYGHCSNSASNKTLKIYTTDSYTTTQEITDRKKVVYQNQSNQFCIGVIVVDEF